ncbi:uncharacterized protein LOC110990212 [Acanthaster planci]|uniref:Uncharacterized protein LOC110990212 n=1 Tax=Acanthaster planci TaxID=133434 RepID=A0A8B8A4D7_ACAPL|nr:uncharacterized protein LOC110990212 [Acanthaster planci]
MTCFQWRDKFFEQSSGTSMGSPLSPVLADLFMEEFEQTAHLLCGPQLEPNVWIRYVDDTFVVWPHSPQDLQLFLQHLNSQHNNIQFTMEKEKDGRIAFLGNTSHRIQSILLHHGIKVFHTTSNKIQATLQSHKDKQDPKTKPGVYRIPCERGKVYIGETGRDLTTRLNEHRAHERRGNLQVVPPKVTECISTK